MRKLTRGAAALVAFGLGALTLAASAPSAKAQRAERGMLGVRLWNSFNTVLAKHGPPTSVETGLVMPGTAGAAAQTAGMGGMAGAGGMTPGMMPGMGGPGGTMGGGGGYGGYAAAMQRMNQMRSGGAMGGAMGLAPMGKGGMPGLGAPSGEEMMPGGLGGPGGLAAGQGVTASQGEEVAATWVYQRGSITDTFAFNKDGRVIQIASFNPLAAQGHVGGGGVTARGVQLGDPAAKVYKKYGWAKIDESGGAPLLDYTRKDHVAFYMAHGKHGPVVTGIAITLLDNLPGAVQPAGPETLANNGMMGPMGGMMGGMGMMGPMGGAGKMGIGPAGPMSMGAAGRMGAGPPAGKRAMMMGGLSGAGK